MPVDARLPAKWRMKAVGKSAGGSKGFAPVKVEVEEQKLSWDVKDTSAINEATAPVAIKVEESSSKKTLAANAVIDVDAELGEEEMDLSSTRSNSPVAQVQDELEEQSVLKELNDFMTSFTVMLKDDPEGVRKRAKEDINSFFSSSCQPSSSIVKPALLPAQVESLQYIDLTDLVEPPPLVTDCSYVSLPSASDNQVYLSLLDSDDEGPEMPAPCKAQPIQIKEENSDPCLDAWNIPPRANRLPLRMHKHGLPSPPASDPTPERERSRSASVALVSVVPATIKEKLDPVVVKEEEIPPRTGLATPPPTATKRPRTKEARISLPSPPLSSTEPVSPVMGRLTPSSPTLHTKAISLKRKAPDSNLTIKIPSPAARAQMSLPNTNRNPTTKRKRRKIKSAAFVVDDSPVPERPKSVFRPPPIKAPEPATPVPKPIRPISNPPFVVKQEPDLEQSSLLLAAPTKRPRGRPPKKKKSAVFAPDSRPPSPQPSPIKQKKPRGPKPHVLKSTSIEMQHPPVVPLVKQEETDLFSSHVPPSLDTLASGQSGLRRSQRIPKPRVKKEIEEFINVPPPTRKPRPVKSEFVSFVGAQNAPALPDSDAVRSTAPRAKRPPGRPPKIKAEPVEPSTSVPDSAKVFIRIPAAKIRQIALHPPTYEIE